MTTLGRPESFRIAYQAALHDLAQMTAERDALKRQVGDKYEIAGRSLLGVMHVDSRIEELENRAFGQLERAVAASEALVRQRDTAIARAETAEAEVKRLRQMLDYAASKMELNAGCVAAFRAGADAEKDGSHIIESLDSSAKNVRAVLAQKEVSHD
jgi:hypothetical protein